MKRKNEIDHRVKKNPRSADLYQKQREAKNATRGKQIWVGGESIKEGGHWERITVGSKGNQVNYFTFVQDVTNVMSAAIKQFTWNKQVNGRGDAPMENFGL